MNGIPPRNRSLAGGARQDTLRKRPGGRPVLPRRTAFTLVELLVVIAIIGVLTALLLPAINGARELTRRTTCQNNLRQIGAALNDYHRIHEEFPPGCVDREGQRHAWSTYVLPHLDQAPLFDVYQWRYAFNADENREATEVILSVYLCPSTNHRMPDRRGNRVVPLHGEPPSDEDDMACSDYGGMFGDGRAALNTRRRRRRDQPSTPSLSPQNGVLVWDTPIALADVTDGASNTIAVAEDTGRGAASDGQWSNGENIFDVTRQINQVQDNEIWSDHRGGANVVLCGGAVKFLSEATDLPLLAALCSRNGRETSEADTLNQ